MASFPSADPSPDPEIRDPVEELAESFLERHRRGERPSIEELASAHPDLAPRIRDLFPLLLAMEGFGAETSGTASDGAAAPVTRPRERLGEYRLLREIGRGGMGVVYEAEQESLGRRVALKVLSQRAFLDANQLERFRQEARAAARLHHTNIVPVFGVGEDGGVHYYAMQFIRGKSLAEVLEEVRRLRREGRADDTRERDAAERAPMEGRTVPEVSSEAPSSLEEAGGSGGPVAGSPEEYVEGVSGEPSSSRPPSSSDHLLAAAESGGRRRESRSAYALAVARIGLQVAEALAHAHAAGILHRDIKPSNLLLDLRGVVWVTDFGLAKDDESNDLTATGNIVGTLRYMAPERFHGSSDERSDVYGLGITLYELVTLRPAFASGDRAQLVREIMTTEPRHPRRIDPTVPRDLETIVLKAMDPEPARRYQSAAGLAEDLRRFLDLEPVAARRASPAERLWRWCQRNTAVALLSAWIAALVVALAVGGVLSAVKLRAERDTAFERLALARLAEGRAWRRSGAIGQRTRALRALAEAAEGGDVLAVRNEVIASLALTDLEVIEESRVVDRTWSDDFLEYRASRGPEGVVLVHGEDAAPLALLEGPERVSRRALFSPSSRYLVVEYETRAAPLLVWDIARESVLLELDRVAGEFAVAFRADEEVIAHRGADRVVVLRSLAGGEVLRRLEAVPACARLVFDPTGTRLAIGGSGPYAHVVWIFDLVRGEITGRLYHGASVAEMAWHPSERLLAVACLDFRVHLWDTEDARRRRVLEGHTAEVIRVEFDHRGDILASAGWDQRTRLWDAYSGAALVTAPGWFTSFSADDRRLGFVVGDSLRGEWRVVGGGEQRRLPVDAPSPTTKLPYSLHFAPAGDRLAAVGLDEIRLWAPGSGGPPVLVPVRGVEDAQFLGDGSLLSSGSDGLLRWPVRHEQENVVVGRPEELGIRGGRFDVDGRDRFLAILEGWTVVLWDLDVDAGDGPRETARWRHDRVHRVDVSEAGRWVVSTTWHGLDTRVWSLDGGGLVRSFGGGTAQARFSPDERWLAVDTAGGCTVYSTGTWGEHIRIEHLELGQLPSPVAFSQDSELLALAGSRTRIALIRVETGEEVAGLETSADVEVAWLEFEPHGHFLAAASLGWQAVELWNLRAIRRELDSLGLDWRPPPSTAPAPAAPPAGVVVRGVDGASPRRRASRSGAAQDLELVELYTRIAEIDPRGDATADRAAVHARRGAFTEAIADLDRALAYDPDDDGLIERRAELELRMGREERALEDLDRVVALRRERFDAAPVPSTRRSLIAALRARAALHARMGREPLAERDREAVAELGGKRR